MLLLVLGVWAIVDALSLDDLASRGARSAPRRCRCSSAPLLILMAVLLAIDVAARRPR